MLRAPRMRKLIPMTVSLGEAFHDPAHCHWGGRPHLGPCRDRSREADFALTHIRTVLSHAETALRMLLDYSTDGHKDPLECPRLPKRIYPAGSSIVDSGPPPADLDGRPFDDPDHTVMVAVLGQVITALRPWRRGAGKTLSWVADTGPAQLLVAGPPDWYEGEVGDEQFMAVQAVLTQLRARLAAHFLYDPDIAGTVLGVMDEFMRELVDEQAEDDEEQGV